MSTSLQRRRQAKGWRSASASRRPGFARASCSVSRSSTSTGGKGACLNGAAAAAAALYTAHASIELPSGREGADERPQVENSNLRSARACPNQYFPALLRPRAPCSRASQVSTLHSPSTSAARMLRAGCRRRRPRPRRARVLPRATGRRRRLRSRRASRATRPRERSSRAACVWRVPARGCAGRWAGRWATPRGAQACYLGSYPRAHPRWAARGPRQGGRYLPPSPRPSPRAAAAATAAWPATVVSPASMQASLAPRLPSCCEAQG